MKRNINILLMLFVSAAISTSAVYAHGKKKDDHDKPEYDATTEEFGQYHPDMKPVQTIEISMADTMRFTPGSIKVSAGDVVRFVVTNNGQLKHEFVLGTADSLKEHAALMVRFPNLEHEEPYMAHVDPGSKMDVVWKFTTPGAFEFGCLLPGHYDAGMKGTVEVQ